MTWWCSISSRTLRRMERKLAALVLHMLLAGSPSNQHCYCWAPYLLVSHYRQKACRCTAKAHCSLQISVVLDLQNKSICQGHRCKVRGVPGSNRHIGNKHSMTNTGLYLQNRGRLVDFHPRFCVSYRAFQHLFQQNPSPSPPATWALSGGSFRWHQQAHTKASPWPHGTLAVICSAGQMKGTCTPEVLEAQKWCPKSNNKP